jgi:hypothetical protein
MDQGIGYAASSDGLAENSKKLENEKNRTDYTESLLQEMDATPSKRIGGGICLPSFRRGWQVGKVEINPTIAFSPMYSTILPKVFAEFAIASRMLKNLSNSFLNSSLSMTLIPQPADKDPRRTL